MAIIGFWNTLAEAELLTQTILLRGVIEEIIEEGHLVPSLPVTQIDGKDLSYNREKDTPDAAFYAIGEEIASQANEDYDPVTVALKRAIGQWDLDAFITMTYRNINDLRALAIQRARKGVGRTVENVLLYGDKTANPKEFDGLHKLVVAAQTINQGSSSTGAALSLENLDKLIDSVKPKPNFLLMNFELHRRLSAVGRGGTTSYPVVMMAQAAGGNIEPMIASYRNIPILRTDFLTQTETIASGDFSAKTGGATSSIFAPRFDAVDAGGISLLTGNPAFEMFEWERLENKDSGRIRLVWYLSLAMGSTKSLGVIDGITDVAVVE